MKLSYFGSNTSRQTTEFCMPDMWISSTIKGRGPYDMQLQIWRLGPCIGLWGRESWTSSISPPRWDISTGAKLSFRTTVAKWAGNPPHHWIVIYGHKAESRVQQLPEQRHWARCFRRNNWSSPLRYFVASNGGMAVSSWFNAARNAAASAAADIKYWSSCGWGTSTKDIKAREQKVGWQESKR
jgi:hypothetical protein